MRFRSYAWGVMWGMIPVILWGAFVRISKSGAGCGEHWPTCQGEVVPLAASTETLIEFTHRAMSGLLGLAAVILVVWAWRAFPRHHPVRKAAMGTLLFVLAEGAIGAMLVLLGLVGDDARPVRGLVIAIHLVNTLGLLGCATLTAHLAGGGSAPDWRDRRRSWAFVVGLVLMALTAATGAVTALGDTLFPVELGLGEGLWPHIQAELSSGQHLLVRLRAVHPMIAVVGALFLLYLAHVQHDEGASPPVRFWALRLALLVVLQVALGLANVALAAPAWMQLAHLLVADLIWIGLVMLTIHALATEPEPVAAAE